MKRGQRGAAAGAHPGDALRVGGALRERRLGLGLTPEEVGEAIRFGSRHILAVEEGRLADLPPQPYVRGLVTAYATLVGISPEELRRLCGPAIPGAAGHHSRGSVFRVPARERFSWREWTVPFALAAAVVSLVVARRVLEPAPVELRAPATAPAWLQRALPESPAPADHSPPAETPATAPASAPAPGVRVTLRSEGTTWFEAAPDGASSTRYDLGPGQILEVAARERLALTLGDGGVIRVNLNGRELGYVGYKGERKSGLLFTAPKAAPAPAAGNSDED